jgi:hypothetical protein
MLGLGNAINKARRRTVFVSTAPDQPEFEVLDFGSLGQAGYVIQWQQVDDDGIQSDSGNNIKYTEVYPSHFYFGADGDQSKATLADAGPAISNHVVVSEGEENATDYSGWRMANPGEFDSFLNYIYSDSEYSDEYQVGDLDNPYMTVRTNIYNGWVGNDYPSIVESSGWVLSYTDGGPSSFPLVDQINNESHYFLVVRQFTKAIDWAAPTTPPPLSPIPLNPNPSGIQSRGSGDLLASATDEDNFESINLSVNGDLLSDGNTQFYIADPTYSFASGQTSDKDISGNILNKRFRLYFTISFPTDPSATNNAFSLPEPWGPLNTEQKFIDLSAVILGHEDKPLYNPVEDDTTVFSSADQQDDYFDRRVSQRVFLNKVPGIGSLPDGFFIEGATIKFGYEGYLDMKEFNSSHAVSTIPTDGIKFKDAFKKPGIDYVSTKKLAFLIRIDQASYGTANRPLSDPIGLPEGMSHIIFPILHEDNCILQYSSITGDADYPILSMFNPVQSASALPPEIPGQTEDYYD